MSEAVEAEIIEPEEASELTVAYSPAVIEANFDALEAHVGRLVADYEGATYDMGKDENVKAAKRDRAYLNGIAKEIDERRKAEHAAGLALDEHAVADAGIGMVARGDVERLGLQTAAAAALGAVMAARRTARYLDLCPAAGEQLFDGSLLGHFDSVLIFTLVIAYSGLYSSMMRNAARMPSTAADMMPPA